MSERTDARDELKRELRVFLHDSDADDVLAAIDRARTIGALIETAMLELHDPEAIEHAVIAAIAMQHLHDRVAELAGVDDELVGEEAVA